MFRNVALPGLCIIMVITMAVGLRADAFMESLQQGQKVQGFSTTNIYENAQGKAMGARFVSDKYGFVVDLLQIQSVPQGFFWIKTPPSDDMGEPHTCEHLLLGKGKLGRYVSALEDMSLGRSSAWTSQTSTVYHFHTIAGEETFYTLFEAKLNALLNPDFTDEEIRREVCHVGYNIDPGDSSLSLDEKGTVYTEMVSAYERPSRYLWKILGEVLYGEDHPLANVAGGYPDDIRKMRPEDLRNFHKQTHNLANSGVIVAIPESISVEECLAQISQIMSRCQTFTTEIKNTGMTKFDLPPAAPKEKTAVTQIVPAPAENPEEPSSLIIAWPANLDYDLFESIALDIFLSAFAGGTASNLYDLFINSQTRKIDLGANSVYGFVSSDMGHPILFGLGGVGAKFITMTMLDSVRNMVIGEIRNVYNYADGSPELGKFNEFASGILSQGRKQAEKLLNSPPLFGYRLTGGEWQDHLSRLEMDNNFRKSLVLTDQYEQMQQMLSSNKNFWKKYIDKWHLLTIQPHVIGAKPDPAVLQKLIDDKKARIDSYVAEFKKKYSVSSEHEALAKFREEFDARTAELEAIAAKDEIPGFIDNPPLTLDDQLDYQVMTMSNGVKMVASTFNNMTASQIGIALKLNVIPEDKLVYVPFLPDILTDIGTIENGRIIQYDEMRNRLREEVLDFNAYFDYGLETGRVELVLKASGNNRKELENGLRWMDLALYSPYLDTANSARLLDIIDQSLVSLRNVMKGSEESWVRFPANGYRFQTNPLIMTTYCFLTKVHHYQRLKWLLTDPGSEPEQKQLSEYIALLKKSGKGKDRQGLKDLLSAPPPMPSSEKAQKIAGQIIIALESSLADIPDENLMADWDYLLAETEADLMIKPQKAIEDMKAILALIRTSGQARMFMISNAADRDVTLDEINAFAAKLDSKSKSQAIQYHATYRVVEKLKSRAGKIAKPTYVGLVNRNTQNGVMVFNARNAGMIDTSDESILTYLAGNLYGGGGGHGLFMKTWGAGLAYSNGYGMGPLSGIASYYAERCPDIAETMRFVVDILNTADSDPRLANYAIAQAFLSSRAPSQYETRGEAMASDLEDGFLPEKVRAYRQKVLSMRDRADLYPTLVEHMKNAYGAVLIGYGKPLSQSREGNYFIIGPDEQFKLLENYLASTEGPQTVYKLYPRDFWLTI